MSVNLLVQALHLLTHPDDLLAKATVAKLYQQMVLGNITAENELLIKDCPLDDLLPKDYLEHHDELLQLPLYELTERLYTIFGLERLEDQSAYICAFYDQLNQFMKDNTTDIDAFVSEWEETICRKTIHADATEGVRILSIHKSKGLEFDHVVLPYCDWRLEMPDILWCRPKEAPFDALPIVPVDYSGSQMRGTIYEDDYLDEHMQNTVDNLNLLYVAFTRAAKSLYVIGQRKAKNNRSTAIEAVLPTLQLEGAVLEGLEDEEVPLEFTYGEAPVTSTVPAPTTGGSQQEQPRMSENVFLQPVKPAIFTLETFAAKTEFRQSNKSRDFIEGDDDEQQVSYIKLGSVLHEIFSTIRTTADIDWALLALQHDGVLYNDEVTSKKLIGILSKRLEDGRISNWFSDRWTLFNECAILRIDEQGKVVERRPDRVMTDGQETLVVDFKFGKPKAAYREQVCEYMQLLQQMGMPNVQGFLWYVYSNRIEEVKSEEIVES